jgi:hypothetical protein
MGEGAIREPNCFKDHLDEKKLLAVCIRRLPAEFDVRFC